MFRILQNGLELSDGDLHTRFGRTLSLALGAYEVSPLENSVLYSLLVNGGNFIKPYGMRYVKDYNGNIVWNNEDEVRRHTEEKRVKLGKIIDPRACSVTVSMLRGVFEDGGTAYYAVKNRKISFPIAGKTGTTSNYSDAWFVGCTADLVTAVWVGNKKGAISLGKGRAGSVISANIWADYTASIYNDEAPGVHGPGRRDIATDDMPRFRACAAEPGLCPRTAVDVLFYAGTEPGEYCPLHVRK